MGRLRALGVVAAGCLLLAVSYLLVLYAVSALYRSPLNPRYRPGYGLDPGVAPYQAVALIVLPYALGGLVLGLAGAARHAPLTALLATLAERLVILGLAARVLGQFRLRTPAGGVAAVEGDPDLVTAIRAEALPYFGWGYILLGVPASVLLMALVARGVARRWRR